MPSGDAQRTWFPAMIQTLRQEWKACLTFEDWIALRDRLDAMLQTIRTTRQILPPIMWCRRCQKYQRARPPKVSVRAAILTLRRFGLATPGEVKDLEKRWQKYRQTHGLDLYGKPAPQGGVTPLPDGDDHDFTGSAAHAYAPAQGKTAF